MNRLPPLLEPIVFNEETVLCPFIEVIYHTKFHILLRMKDNGEPNYKRLPRLLGDKTGLTETFKFPVMASGLFAMNKS